MLLTQTEFAKQLQNERIRIELLLRAKLLRMPALGLSRLVVFPSHWKS